MNLIEKILNNKEQISEKQTLEIEMPRISKIIGEPCVFKISGLSIEELVDNEKLGGKDKIKGEILNIISSITIENQKISALKSGHEATPYDTILTIFEAGEIKFINDKILLISGFGINAVTNYQKVTDIIQSEVDETIKKS